MICHIAHKSHLGIERILLLIATVRGEEPMRKFDIKIQYIMLEHTQK